MPHFFINSKDVNDGEIIISEPENYNHIAKSLRTKVGEKLLLIDENKIQYETVVVDINKKEITVNVENSYKSSRMLDFGLYIAQSPLRSEAQSIIVEKAVELGIKGLYPIISDNCSVSSSIIQKKIPKWQKIMYESSKQCERATIPTCFELTDLKTILESNYKIIAFCERYTNLKLNEYFKSNPLQKGENIIVIIGPEGGFSKREFEMFKENNIPMLTLGDMILRAETAVIVALGNLIYEYNRKN